MKVKFPVVPTLYKIVIIVSLLVFFSVLLVNHFVKMPIFEGLDASESTPTDASESTPTDASGSTPTDASGGTITSGSTMVPKPNVSLTSSPTGNSSDSSAYIITNLQIFQATLTKFPFLNRLTFAFDLFGI